MYIDIHGRRINLLSAVDVYKYGRHLTYTTSITTSTFPLIAFEYGQFL